MTRYILKRILLMIPVILGISLLVFSMMELSPGDPAQIILGIKATPENLDALREQLGLNKPFWTRYFTYVAHALQGDFGTSWRTGVPVLEEILARFPSTIRLAFGSMCLMVLLGIPIGIISAVKQYSILDNMTLTGALIFSSMPGFWLGTLLILLFSLQLNWLPATGGESFRSYILPWITLAASSLATLARMTRSSMLEVIRADYMYERIYPELSCARRKRVGHRREADLSARRNGRRRGKRPEPAARRRNRAAQYPRQ